MELTEIDLETIDDAHELISIASHASNVVKKVDTVTAGYAGIDNFPIFKGERKDDGLVHVQINSNEPFTMSPGDFNNMMIHLRDQYFNGVRDFADKMRKEGIGKGDGIINPEEL